MCMAHAIKNYNQSLWLLKVLYERKYEMKVMEAADKKGTCSIVSTHREPQSHKCMKQERILTIFKCIHCVCQLGNVILSNLKVQMLHTTSKTTVIA